MADFRRGLSQSLGMRQELKINPRLYQAMDLLYMPLLDLQAHLKLEVLVNPFLEFLRLGLAAGGVLGVRVVDADQRIEIYATMPAIAGRRPKFVYFGGGTPSYLSARQLRSLRERLAEYISWDNAEEVTFECEPGTLRRRHQGHEHEVAAATAFQSSSPIRALISSSVSSTPSMMFRLPSSAARCSAWSASRAAANPPSAAWSPAFWNRSTPPW